MHCILVIDYRPWGGGEYVKYKSVLHVSVILTFTSLQRYFDIILKTVLEFCVPDPSCAKITPGH